MTLVRDILATLCELAPLELQMEFDNSGFQIGHGEKPVTKALLALDVTDEVVREAIDSGAENNTWILLAGGANSGAVRYRPGDEFENSSNALIDLIHWGWFDNRTVFIAYKRELSREKDRISQDPFMEKINPEYKNRFTFYSVF